MLRPSFSANSKHVVLEALVHAKYRSLVLIPLMICLERDLLKIKVIDTLLAMPSPVMPNSSSKPGPRIGLRSLVQVVKEISVVLELVKWMQKEPVLTSHAPTRVQGTGT